MFTQKRYPLQYRIAVSGILSILLLIVFFCVPSSSTTSYIPFAPDGPDTGFTNTSYPFTIHTQNQYSQWRFDWGDTMISDWISYSDSASITMNHQWTNPGEYKICIQNKNKYAEISPWSPPLYITIIADSDLDGWSDYIEQSYSTDPFSSLDFPLDTDQDGIADESSPDNQYLGDTDDDNDGFLDSVEEIIGSNPKQKDESVFILIGETSYYFFDITHDGKSDVLYDPSENTILVLQYQGSEVFLDINGDNNWEYQFSTDLKTVYPYETQSTDMQLFGYILCFIFVFCILVFVLVKSHIINLNISDTDDETPLE